MDPLPKSNTNISINPSSSGGTAKEKEMVGGSSSEIIRPVREEIELSPEVSSAGVKLAPTAGSLSPAVAKMGVTSVGQTNQPAPSITLPLTDDQIAQGLHQSVTSSWRWLAEWCLRRIKQLHQLLIKRGA